MRTKWCRRNRARRRTGVEADETTAHRGAVHAADKARGKDTDRCTNHGDVPVRAEAPTAITREVLRKCAVPRVAVTRTSHSPG